MRSHLIRPAAAAVLLGLAAAFLVPATLARAETVRIRYSISLLGLSIGAANLTGTLSPGAYRLDVSAKVTGLASVMGKSNGAASSSGAIVKGKLSPATYATTAANSKETRTVRMSFAGSAVTGLDVSPPFEEKPGRVPLTDDSKRNVLDPLGAVLMTVPASQPLLGKAACERTIPIFDGNTRFNIGLSFTGLKKVSGKGYDGDVAVCAVRYTPIAGHRPDRKATKFMTDNKDIEVWLAPLESAHALVPYFMSVATQIGTTTLNVEDFQVSGK